MTIVVLGSINADLVVRAPRLPLAGETLRGTSFAVVPGGKGANQAVAAARHGATVSIVGAVGADDFGPRLVDALEQNRVDTSGVTVDPDAATGVASIVVSESGDNAIVTVGGANHRVGRTELRALDERLPDATVFLVQLEIPIAVVQDAVRRAHARGTVVVLDPAPVAALGDDLLADVDWITPNVIEAEVLTGIAPLDESDARRAAEMLRRRGVDHVVITLGAEGCVYSGAEGSFRVEPPSVDVVDTVAAGDAFNGTLAASLDRGDDVGTALERACAAGALATTRSGALPSMPTGAEVDALLARNR